MQIEEEIKKVYADVLEREADPEGLKHFTIKIKNNQISMDDVIRLLKSSREYYLLNKKEFKLEKFSNVMEKQIRSDEEIDRLFTVEQLNDKISKIRWFQLIPLGTKVTTTGNYLPHYDKAIFDALPKDFTNKSVLDIGTCDGKWAFESEKRNAKRIVAVDAWQTSFDQNEKPFRICKEIFNSKAVLYTLDVLDVEKLNEKFDVILFLGIFYHMMDPFLALQKLFDVCNELVIMEGEILQSEQPISYCFKSGELNDDVTAVFAFSPSFIETYALRIGFKKVDFLGYINDDGRLIGSENDSEQLKRNRGIFYLYK